MAKEGVPNPRNWLYNLPSEGIASKWYTRNLLPFQARGGIRILDMAVLLASPFERWDGQNNVPYSLDQVDLTMSGPEVYPTGPELNRIWQDLSNNLRKGGERIDPKTHLYSYSERADGTLKIVTSKSDWTIMVLGPLLRDGQISENCRDEIMPIESPVANGSTSFFYSSLPNHLVLHLALLSSDKHLILTTRGRGVAFEQGTISASVEQHIHPSFPEPLLDTINSTVSTKLKDEAELNLTLKPETLRVGAILIEPNVNNTGIVVVGQCEEDSSQVGPELIGSGRRAEFASDHPVRTLPIDKPEVWLSDFYNSRQLWHGTSRLRMALVLCYIYGHEEALDRLHRASQ